jgi:hypothetical protein
LKHQSGRSSLSGAATPFTVSCSWRWNIQGQRWRWVENRSDGTGWVARAESLLHAYPSTRVCFTQETYHPKVPQVSCNVAYPQLGAMNATKACRLHSMNLRELYVSWFVFECVLFHVIIFVRDILCLCCFAWSVWVLYVFLLVTGCFRLPPRMELHGVYVWIGMLRTNLNSL